MLKGTVSRLVVPLAMGCSGLLLLAGCENAQRAADASAAAQVEKAEKARQEAVSADDLSKAQGIYDSVAKDSALSPQQKILTAASQAQLHYERLIPQIAELQSKQFAEVHLIGQLMELAHQVSDAQSQSAALLASDPSARIAALQARIADMQGDGGKMSWSLNVQGAKVSGPTLSKLKADIEDLNQKIAANKQETETTQKAKSDANVQAETLTRNSEGETGDQQQQDETNASKLRKDATYADSHINVLSLALTKLQTQLDWNLSQQKTVQDNIDSFNRQIESIKGDWKVTQEQIANLQKGQQQLIAGDGNATSLITTCSITGLSDKLAALLQDSTALRSSLSTELGSVVDQFTAVKTKADSLRGSLNGNSRGTDPINLINQGMMQTLHPSHYQIQAAIAKQQLADLSAGGTEIDWLVTKMMKGCDTSPAELAELVTASESAGASASATGGGGSPLHSLGNFLAHMMNSSPAAVPATMPDMASTTQPAATEPSAPVMVKGPKVHVDGLATVLNKEKTGIDVPKTLASLQLLDDPSKQKSDVDGMFSDAVQAYADAKSLPTDTATGDDAKLENMHRSDTSLVGQVSTNIQWEEFDRLMGDADGAMSHQVAANDAGKQVSATVRAAEAAAAAIDAAKAAAAAPPAAATPAAAAAPLTAAAPPAAAAPPPAAAAAPPPPPAAAARPPAAPPGPPPAPSGPSGVPSGVAPPTPDP